MSLVAYGNSVVAAKRHSESVDASGPPVRRGLLQGARQACPSRQGRLSPLRAGNEPARWQESTTSGSMVQVVLALCFSLHPSSHFNVPALRSFGVAYGSDFVFRASTWCRRLAAQV